MDISIIIPVYNEEGNIPLAYKKIHNIFMEFPKSHEIIFINDGSSDNSMPILREIFRKDNCVRVISFDKNYGMTAAIDAGFKNAKGKIILTIDCDLQHDPKDLKRILRELESDNVDAVFGRRINRASGFIREVSSRMAVFVRNRVLKEDYQDCSLAGYKRNCLKDLVLYRGFQVFIPVLLKLEGYTIKEIDIQERRRKHGRSKYGIRNRLIKGLVGLVVVKWLKVNKLKYRIVEERQKSLKFYNIQEYFNAKAPYYVRKAKNILWKAIKQREKEVIFKMLMPTAKDFILDAGCGDGYFLSAMIKKGFKVEGIDFCSQMIEEARKDGFPARVVDLEEKIDSERVYDKIICCGVLEFCNNDIKVLMNLSDVLKLQGIIILLLPKQSFSGLLYKRFHRYWGCKEKVNLYNIERIKKMSSSCNLKIDGIVSPTPYSWAVRLVKLS